MELKHKTRIMCLALLTAWIFDLLFWKKMPGISFPILVAVTLTVGVVLARGEGVKPAKLSYLLLLPIAYFAVMTAIREEPFTTFINYLMTIVSITILALTFTGGKWWNYSISDHVVNTVKLALSTLSKGITLFTRSSKPGNDIPTPDPAEIRKPKRSIAFSIIRGVLLTLPVIAILTGLLATADPIFKQNFSALFKIFDADKIAEYIFRGVYILILAYMLAGAYLHAISNSADEKLIGEEKPWPPKILGWIEAVILLGSIDLLFGFFVGIQFKYFFGGQTNIMIDGYTYAEYARKGFFELISVAVITLFILQMLNSLAKRQFRRQAAVFTGLSIAMVLLVLVILISAFQRLSLYETVYGFTRLRTYSHTFMVWLGFLLAATVVLEFVKRTRLFALALLIAAYGFGMTLNMINVDGFIARQNIQKGISPSNTWVEGLDGRQATQNPVEVDINYLVTLSADSIPEIARQYSNPALNSNQHDLIGAALACKNYFENSSIESNAIPWMSFHFSRSKARQLLNGLSPDLARFPIKVIGDYMPSTEINGKTIYCQGQNWID